jgi:hypothetical protein
MTIAEKLALLDPIQMPRLTDTSGESAVEELLEALAPTEDKPKTYQQMRKSMRNRKHRANQKEARKRLAVLTGVGEKPILVSPCLVSQIVGPPPAPPVIMSKNRRRKVRRAKEKEKKTQDAAQKKAAEISRLAQELKPLPIKESSTQASGIEGRGVKFNPASNVGCVAILLESLTALVGIVQAGAWSNGPPVQGKKAGQWRPWKKRGTKT